MGGWALANSCFLVDCEREAERPEEAETEKPKSRWQAKEPCRHEKAKLESTSGLGAG